MNSISKLGMVLAVVAFFLFQWVLAPKMGDASDINPFRSLAAGAVVCGGYVLGFIIEMAMKKK